MHIHVLMLCRNFEQIPIKIGFYMNFRSCSKFGPNTVPCTVVRNDNATKSTYTCTCTYRYQYMDYAAYYTTDYC